MFLRAARRAFLSRSGNNAPFGEGMGEEGRQAPREASLFFTMLQIGAEHLPSPLPEDLLRERCCCSRYGAPRFLRAH
jgi:hypothetical protein